MNITNKLYFNEEAGGTQHGFTSLHLDDLIGFVYENRDPNFYLLDDEVPYFDSTITINMYHPSSPDSLCLYLFQDENGNWWPYATLDCLTCVKYILKSIWVYQS